MGWPVCNTTEEDMIITEEPLWDGHTFHQVGLVIAAIFSLIAVIVSFFLIFMHATHYLKPWEQKHIIRILFMVPVYAAVSFLSYYYYNHSVYFEVIRDCYEAFAIASFFSLLCAYIAPDLHQQKVYFRTITPKKWIWPMRYFQTCTGGAEKGFLRTPRSGLTWFNVIWVSIFQYCFIRVFFTLVAVITQAFDRYCLESLNPAFSHVWVMVFEAIAVTIAMYCLIQFYVQIRADISQHKPLLKITAIKLVIFLSFWQTICISFLTSAGAIKPTDKVQTPDIKVGIPALLLCIEMAIFAVFHVWSFSWKPYTIGSKEYMAEIVPGEEGAALSYQGGFGGVKAVFDSFNGWDMLKATGRAAKWLVRDRKRRHNDSSYDLSRKDTQGSGQFGPDDPKLSNLGGSTAYTGATRPPHYSGVDGGEGDNLLANSQSIPMSRPPIERMPSDRSDGGNEYDDTSDIGLAISSDDDKYTSPDHQPPHSQNAPYSSSTSWAGGQESSIVGVPYPDPQRERLGQHSNRENRVSMPFMPPPQSFDPRSQNHHHNGMGNFL
ncbi:uncharacterized protein Z518_00610 [Rhinocladiella mackenziei CBS 650.93]|uniref:DUF300-domain-containing protein n=1 Tax=Rhinocladiella mackenziei CBS 650.93 TaxID=1442369 RepID=A0A0D2JJF5_9EURO|nr:uncharacterized protein Z518_00610 [Rhinocladiella mackenziei CBS 650.93]KIX09530.1 hypothetical protein Z518_00610 [Rhinocladiella mackenziei CBS 650.93]